MYLKVDHPKGVFYFYFDCDSRFFAYRYVLELFERQRLEAPSVIKVVKMVAGPLALTVLPPCVKKNGKQLPDYGAPMWEWEVLACQEAQLALGVPQFMIDAEKAKVKAQLSALEIGGPHA